MAVEGYGESGYEAAARGLSPDAIQMLGINSAMSNVLTDKILLRACRGQHGFVRSVTEGSVEGAYEWLLTDTVDNWVSGDLSRQDSYYRTALAEGQTPEEAKATICEIRKQELLQAMAVGGTMSGMAWGGGRAVDYLINRINPGPVSPDTPESVNPLQEEGISEILEVGNSGDGTDGVPSEGGTDVIQSKFNKLLNSDYYKTDFGYDCSEIAQDFYDAAGNKGTIYRIEGKNGFVNGYDYDDILEFEYHEVYSDGTYIYDPRYLNTPVLKDDYFRALREINPDGFDVFTKQ